MLYALNLSDITCQLYLNELENSLEKIVPKVGIKNK